MTCAECRAMFSRSRAYDPNDGDREEQATKHLYVCSDCVDWVRIERNYNGGVMITCEEFQRIMTKSAFEINEVEENSAAEHLGSCAECNTWVQEQHKERLRQRPEIEMMIIQLKIAQRFYRMNNWNTS